MIHRLSILMILILMMVKITMQLHSDKIILSIEKKTKAECRKQQRLISKYIRFTTV